jgi:hypothetical protein
MGGRDVVVGSVAEPSRWTQSLTAVSEAGGMAVMRAGIRLADFELCQIASSKRRCFSAGGGAAFQRPRRLLTGVRRACAGCLLKGVPAPATSSA